MRFLSQRRCSVFCPALAKLQLTQPPRSGCTTGTGYWAAIAAARKGAACILMLNRKSGRADAALAKVKAEASGRVETVEVDLQSFASVKAAAAKVNAIAAEFGGLDALVNNAGIMAVPDHRTTDG